MRRFVQSLWVLIPLVTIGWLAGTAFLYAGLRGRHRIWTLFGVVYLITGLAGFILIDPDDESFSDQLGFLLSLGTMGIAFVHALAIRKAFLRRIGAAPAESTGLGAAEAILEERRRA